MQLTLKARLLEYRGARIAVAVSGGADSLALTLLAAEAGLKPIALTVDHGLRTESASEAQYVARLLAKRGIEHHILTHKRKIPKSNVQAWARDLRYELMLSFCKEHRIGVLMLAHQREDNIENFFLHLERGSGLKGLAGMKPVSEREGVKILRPLLEVPRAELEAYLKKKRIKWVDDPSNENDKYRRSELRKALAPFFAKTPNLAERIAGSIRFLAEADAVLETLYQEEKAEILTLSPKTAALDAKKLADSPFKLRLLSAAIGHVSGREDPPRAASLTRALGAKHFTLHGVKGEQKSGKLLLKPEK